MKIRLSSTCFWLLVSAVCLAALFTSTETAMTASLRSSANGAFSSGVEKVRVSAAVAAFVGQEGKGTTTEWSSSQDKDGNQIITNKIRDKDTHRLVEERVYKNGKLRKRTTYNWPKEFIAPNTSTTEYGPDGQTPQSTTNVDLDKDGNLTSTVTTNYDEKGNETGGSKRERDPKTGKEHCYKWDPKKQQYEEVPCPQETAQSSSQPPAKPSPTPASAKSENARVETGGGVHTVIFDTPPGQIRVYLPDDMRAGDTISGTVVAEPKGQTPEERAKNMAELNGYVIELEPPKKPDGTSSPKVKYQVYAPIPQLRITLPPGSTPTPPLTNVSSGSSGGLGITLTNPSGSLSTIGTTTVPIEMVSLNLQSVAPLNSFDLPTIGQQGRPIEIFGPFDGNITNTKLMYGPTGSSAQDFEKNTENVSGGFGLLQPLAESPRKCVFQAPVTFTGPVQLFVKDGKTENTAPYRNVGVNLSAPKTNLLKGERTTLKVEVTGLPEIKQPVPLTLESQGVITMEGGPYQPIVIQPSQVGADGRYTTTRGITGLQTGAWGATATVVTHRFDVCLQDDSSPQTVIQWNSFTGDYMFTPSGGTSLTGQGTVTRKGCTITLTDSPPDRGVQGNVDPCTKTGSASVQIISSKVKFKITDRNTSDNTCSCGLGCR